MQIEQRQWKAGAGWDGPAPEPLAGPAQLVLLFGSPAALAREDCLAQVQASWPAARAFGCSTAGEIRGTQVQDDSLVATAIRFDQTTVRGARVVIDTAADSFEAGSTLGRKLRGDRLVHVLVLSDGIHVNGSALAAGLTETLPPDITVTGGLSADGARFQQTQVLLDGPPRDREVVAVGLYSDGLRVGCGSLGGWDPFGPERLITRADGNVLYELDGRSALELYKQYLGEHAAGLPATGLLFPLSIRSRTGGTAVVRTILSVDEATQSLTFAGDIPQGCYARLMKANFDRLIDGAAGAARASHEALSNSQPDLAILISCVGRKLVLKQRVEEEVEGVREVLGERTILTGFYSYGEISPFTPTARCELHNQTMTITTLSER